MIELPAELCMSCTEFGFAMQRFYAEHPKDHQLRVADGSYITPYQRAEGKVGECIGAIFFGLDPIEVVDFNVGHNDPGSDFSVGRTRVDIKTSALRYRPNCYLRWNPAKNYRFDAREFDALVLVAVDVSWINDIIFYARGEPVGWIGKLSFRRQRLVADKAIPGLDAGTRYLPEEKLHKMNTFPGRDPLEHYCWCGEWGFLGYRDSDQFVCCEQHMPQL